MKKLLILGAGGFGHTVADLAAQLGYEKIGFLDDSCPNVIGKCDEYLSFQDGNTEFYPAFGNNEGRMAWMDRLEKDGCPVATLIHPSAYVSPRAQVEPGTVILPGAMVNTGCQIGRGCLLNLGAIVDHGCVLEDGVHVCLGAIVKAENRIPRCLKIEAGEIIENRSYPL